MTDGELRRIEEARALARPSSTATGPQISAALRDMLDLIDGLRARIGRAA